MMGESSGANSYVRITKEHDKPVEEEINPGELNQPVRVPHLEGRKCYECGQHLPPSYEPPATEPWTTGVCGCLEDPDSCRMGLFCPCVLYGRNVESLEGGRTSWKEPCACHCVFVEGGFALAAATGFFHCLQTPIIIEGLICTWMLCSTLTGNYRIALQRKYHLQESPCDPSTVHCCLHLCAICQEHREMSRHLENDEIQGTIVDPPATQEMDTGGNKEASTSSGAQQTKTRASLELHPV